MHNIVIPGTACSRNNDTDTYQALERAFYRAQQRCKQVLHKRAGTVQQRLRAQQSALSPLMLYNLAAFGVTTNQNKLLQWHWRRTTARTSRLQWRHDKEDW